MSAVTVFVAPHSEESGRSHELLRAAAALLVPRDVGAVVRGPWGKPFFAECDALHFSITHSGEWWLCAFSDRPVGLDLQRHGSFVPPQTLSCRFFHPWEDAFLASGGYGRFYDVWTAKESYVKFTGRGFYDDPESFSTVAEDGSFPAAAGAQLRHLPFREGYSLCVCAESIGEVVFRELT